MSWFRRRGGDGEGSKHGPGERVLIVGLGNPGSRYAQTRHNIGFEVGSELIRGWDLPKPKQKYRGLITDGRAGHGGPSVTVLQPQTFMNESGESAGPARGALKVPIEQVVVVHDEIDLPFGEIKPKLGGGVAGHNGLKSLAQGFGSRDFWRVRVGVGRPDSTDPEIVSAYVLGRFSEPADEVSGLIADAALTTERLVDQIAVSLREVLE